MSTAESPARVPLSVPGVERALARLPVPRPQSNRVNWYKHGLDVAIDVAQALHFLHCRNIIHFDCKSPNILLSATNSAKLADVGWAQILYHSYITGDGGTFNWAAPEQLIGLKCTAKADVYSYGLGGLTE